MAVVASETFTATSAPIQYAAVSAFKGGLKIERYLMHSRKIVRALGRFFSEKLIKAGVSVELPHGGFYLFPSFEPHRTILEKRGISGSKELASRILEETGVAMLPGVDFGRPENELTLRLAYVDFDGARAITASEQIPAETELDEEFLRYYCANVTDAVDAVCEWLK
jgi:aspartate aminotransferase